MNPLRVVVTAIALGLLTVFSTPATASAATVAAPSRDQITGQPWSAPAYPVTCFESGGQVSCTPTDAAQTTPQKCYLWVLLGGQSTTVCTTFDGHTEAIKTAGGTEALVAYGCSLGDVVCLTFENAGRGMALGATAMMFVVSTNMRFDTSTTLWAAAVGEWSFWNWAVLIVMLSAMVWAVVAAAVSGDRGELVGAVLRAFIAIPAVPLTLWVTGHLLNSMDDLTWYVINRDGPIELFSTLQKVMWAGGSANYFFAFVIDGLLMISMLLLMLVFAFRNIVLAALIMVGPIAWMVFPLRGIGPQWVVRYMSAVVVLLLTGPLTIGFVTLIINGLAGVQTIWDPQSWPLLVGLVLVAFAPFAIFGLFSFVGAVAADGVGSGAASHAGRMASSGARSAVAIPSRLGASPAGIASGARGLSAARMPGGQGSGGAAAVRGAASPAGRSPSSPAGAAARVGAATQTGASAAPAPSTPQPIPSGRSAS